jgi:hypothetical protein
MVPLRCDFFCSFDYRGVIYRCERLTTKEHKHRGEKQLLDWKKFEVEEKRKEKTATSGGFSLR